MDQPGSTQEQSTGVTERGRSEPSATSVAAAAVAAVQLASEPPKPVSAVPVPQPIIPLATPPIDPGRRDARVLADPAYMQQQQQQQQGQSPAMGLVQPSHTTSTQQQPIVLQAHYPDTQQSHVRHEGAHGFAAQLPVQQQGPPALQQPQQQQPQQQQQQQYPHQQPQQQPDLPAPQRPASASLQFPAPMQAPSAGSPFAAKLDATLSAPIRGEAPAYGQQYGQPYAQQYMQPPTQATSGPLPSPSQYLNTPGSTPTKHVMRPREEPEALTLDYTPSEARPIQRAAQGLSLGLAHGGADRPVDRRAVARPVEQAEALLSQDERMPIELIQHLRSSFQAQHSGSLEAYMTSVSGTPRGGPSRGMPPAIDVADFALMGDIDMPPPGSAPLNIHLLPPDSPRNRPYPPQQLQRKPTQALPHGQQAAARQRQGPQGGSQGAPGIIQQAMAEQYSGQQQPAARGYAQQAGYGAIGESRGLLQGPGTMQGQGQRALQGAVGAQLPGGVRGGSGFLGEGGSAGSRGGPPMRYQLSDDTRLESGPWSPRSSHLQSYSLAEQDMQRAMQQQRAQSQQLQAPAQQAPQQQRRGLEMTGNTPFLSDKGSVAPAFGLLDAVTSVHHRREQSSMEMLGSLHGTYSPRGPAGHPIRGPTPERGGAARHVEQRYGSAPGSMGGVIHGRGSAPPAHDARYYRGQQPYPSGQPEVYQQQEVHAEYYGSQQQPWDSGRGRPIPPRVSSMEGTARAGAPGGSHYGGEGSMVEPQIYQDEPTQVSMGYMPDPSTRRAGESGMASEAGWLRAGAGAAGATRAPQRTQQSYKHNVHTLLATLNQQMADAGNKNPRNVVRDMYILIRQFLVQPANVHLLHEAHRYMQETARGPTATFYGEPEGPSMAMDEDIYRAEMLRGFEGQAAGRPMGRAGGAYAPFELHQQGSRGPVRQEASPVGTSNAPSPGSKRGLQDDTANVAKVKQRKNMRPLELLLHANLLAQGDKVFYRNKEGEVKLDGVIQGTSIFVPTLDTLMGCTEFEKAAGSSLRRPTQYIYAEKSGKTLQELVEEAKAKRTSPQ